MRENLKISYLTAIIFFIITVILANLNQDELNEKLSNQNLVLHFKPPLGKRYFTGEPLISNSRNSF